MKEWLEVGEVERGAEKASLKVEVVLVDLVGPEVGRAAKAGRGEKTKGWMECRVLLLEGLCGCNRRAKRENKLSSRPINKHLVIITAGGAIPKKMTCANKF